MDSTISSSQGTGQAIVSNIIHKVINQRISHNKALGLIQGEGASLELSPGMLFQDRAPVAWTRVFGGQSKHASQKSTSLGYEQDYYGFSLGYEQDINTTRIGLIGGLVKSDTDGKNSFATEADHYFLGAYAHYKLTSYNNISTSLIGGYVDYDNERVVLNNINGIERANSDFNSGFLSPSVTLNSAYTLTQDLEIRHSVTATYSIAWLDDYYESGTTNSNLTMDDRTLSAITLRTQIALGYALNATSELEGRIGYQSRHTDDENTHASLGSSRFDYGNVTDDNIHGGFAGLNLGYAITDQLSVNADIEYGRANGDESYASGHLNIEYRL